MKPLWVAPEGEPRRRPAEPDRGSVVAVAGAGLGAGSGFALDQVFSSGEAAGADGVPAAAVGAICGLVLASALRSLRRRRPGVPEPGTEDRRPPVLASLPPHRRRTGRADEYAAAVHRVRASLLYSTRTLRTMIYLAGTTAATGRSGLATDLAVSIAKSGRFVLLAERDVWPLTSGRPGRAIPSEIKNLWLLKASPSASGTDEPRDAKPLESLLKDYNFVIIDGPPLTTPEGLRSIPPGVEGIILVSPTRDVRGPGVDVLFHVWKGLIGVVVDGETGPAA